MDYSFRCPNCGYKIISKLPRHSPECPKCNYLMENGLPEGDQLELDRVIDTIGESRINIITKYNNVIFLDFGRALTDYDEIDSSLSRLGYDVYLREKSGNYHAFLLRKMKDEKSMFSNPIVYIGLFIATVLSTIFAGYMLSQPLVEEGLMENVWNGALSFSLGLIAILGLHEMGHKIQSIRSGISSTWPYFIPMPFLPLGTLGALIKIKSPIPTRNDAVYLGASGPLVGLCVAIPVVLLGMGMSYVVPASSLGEGGVSLGNSILFIILSNLSSVYVPEGMALWIHPLAFAGWVGLFVTMLNLLPAGQLDGGHVVRAIFGDKGHKFISTGMVRVLLLAGGIGVLSEYGVLELQQFFWSGWLIWGVFVYFITKGGHPGPLNELEPLTTNAKIVAFLALLAFVICFVPVPLVLT